jgi:hypothetical protein
MNKDEIIGLAKDAGFPDWWLNPPEPERQNGMSVSMLERFANLVAHGMSGNKFNRGDHVRKIKGSRWQGKVVGFYSTNLTPEGYAVESETEHGSVQIYPAAALELVPQSWQQKHGSGIGPKEET